jgi:hypothetical protein
MPVSNWLARSFADEIKPEACREWAAKLRIEDMIAFLAY